jgi:uncharacterized RDD family membrane protein YckC
MSTLSSTILEPLDQPNAESGECPICLRPIAKPHKCKTLYGVKVCRKCRNGFANRRQAAYLVDCVLYAFASYFIVGGVGGFVFHASVRAQPNSIVTATSAQQRDLGLVLIGIVSWVIMPGLFLLKDAVRGRSPGRLLFGVQVVNVDSREPISIGPSIKRNLCLMIPYIGFIGVVLTMMKGQRWGDRWAKTMVIWRKYATRVPFCRVDRFCRECGYDLTGNTSGRCPECGVEISHSPAVLVPQMTLEPYQ